MGKGWGFAGWMGCGKVRLGWRDERCVMRSTGREVVRPCDRKVLRECVVFIRC